MQALNPATTKRLKMLDPTTFPTAISLAFSKAAVTLTANSGIEVPNATIVRPMIRLDTPIFPAMEDAFSTKQSAPLTRKRNPTMIKIIAINKSILINPFLCTIVFQYFDLDW